MTKTLILQIGLDCKNDFSVCCFRDDVMVVLGIVRMLYSSLTMKLITLSCFVVLCKFKIFYLQIICFHLICHCIAQLYLIILYSFKESHFTMITMFMGFMHYISGLFCLDLFVKI